MTPRALLLDYAGVLTVDMWGSLAAFCAQRGLPVDGLRAGYRPGEVFYELSCELECGRTTVADFEPRLAEVLGVDAHAGLVQGMVGGLAVEPRMVAAIVGLRARGVRLVLFSNSWGEDMYDPVVRAQFDAEVLSGRVGLRKPDPAIYDLAVQAAGVDARECVFVDDQPVNLEPARILGIDTIEHRDVTTTITALRARFEQRTPA